LNPNILKERAAKFLFAWGVSANAVSYAGLALALAAGMLVWYGHFFWAGTALLLSGALDLLDGAVARLTPNNTYFGGILDSSLDRYGDGFVYLGAVFYCLETGRTLYAVLAASALLGSFAISYVRARAECEIDECRVGYWERGERLVVLSLALLFDNLPTGLWILGLGTHLTAFYRLFYSASPATRALRADSSPVARFFLENRRTSRAYFTKCALLFVLLALFRPFF